MAKRNVPDTSRAAYHALQPQRLRDIYQKIIFALASLGEATTQEAGAFLKIDYHVIQKRFNEVEKLGLIVRTDNKRPLRSGAKGYTYALPEPVKTDKQMQVVKALAQPPAINNPPYVTNTTNNCLQQGALFN